HTAVIIGKGTYINRGNFSWIQHSVVVDQTVEILKQIHPELGAEQEQQIRGELQSNLPALNPETVPGLVPNIIAGRIANKLNLMGPSYTVDAACASTLVAADHSIQELLSGRCDLAIMGGAQVTTPLPILNVFCQLNALSRREQIRPFDKDADGTILGEGIGMLVLKRLDDAVRDEDRIYAVIKGVGLSSDGRGTSVMAPRLEGEVAALERAYEAAGVSPRTIGLIEAHGTGTAVGDAVEMQALDHVYKARGARARGVAMGSVKSMIGHTLPASGAAGMIKAALSVYHKTLPPTLHVEEPNPKLGIEDTAFYLNTETRPWVHGSDEWPRRAGVNAFGFGGANAHVVLEEYAPARDRRPRPAFAPWDTEVCILQAGDRQDLIAEAQSLLSFARSNPGVALGNVAKTLNTGLRDGTERLAVVAASTDDLAQKLERAVERLSDPEKEQIKDRRGIYYFSGQPGRTGRTAFLFPGEGAQYPGMLADLYLHFPAVREKFDRMDRLFQDHPRGSLPSEAFFPRPTFSDAERAEVEARLWQIEGAVESVLTADMAMFSLLRRIELEPGVLLGHSSGEYAAIAASSVIDLEDEERFRQFALDLNALYQEEEEKGGVPEARMLAVGADSAQVGEIVSDAGGQLYVAMDNCPHQTVIVGEEEAAQLAEELLRQKGLIYQMLPFERAYHTPLFEQYLGGLREFFANYPVNPPSVETWSAASADRYPTDAEGIRKLMVDHWAQPVQFRKTIEALYSEGVRTFVEVGPRNNLTTFVEDILRGRPHLAVASNVERGSGITQLNHLVGLLAAQGVSLDLEYLYDREGLETVDLDPAAAAQPAGRASREVKLPTGFPMLSINAETAAKLRDGWASHASPSLQTDAGHDDREGLAEATTSREQGIRDGAGEPSANDRMDETGAPAEEGTRLEYGHTNGDSQFAMQQQPQNPMPAGGQDGYSQAMLAYLETMNQFLRTQESVMHAFLGTNPTEGDQQQFTPAHVAGLLGQETANVGNGAPAGVANGAAYQQPM
ncbi:MAG: type I polyketide synthase, partial [Chloroflexota bacterium]